jgi:multiple sugar transport system permease protein
MKKFTEKKSGILNSSDLKTFKGQFVYWLFFVIMIFIGIICVVPSLWTFMTGLKTSQEMYQSSKFFPEELTLQTIKNSTSIAWKAMDATRASFNTLIVSIASTIVTIIVDGLGGYVLSRLRPKGSKLFFVLIVWTMMMPAQIRTVPLYISYISFPFVGDFLWEFNLLNTYWPMILSAASGAFTVMLFKNSFDAISISYIEAARLDGCGNARIFFNIMLPLSVPIIIYVAVGTMRAPWGDFFGPYLILTDKNMQTLPVRVFMLAKDPNVKMNTYMFALILSSIPGLIIFSIFQKHIVGGVNLGGVKG